MKQAMNAKTGILLALILAATVLTYQVSSRLSEQAMETIVGVSCGILAGIPVSLGLLVALLRRRTRDDYEDIEDVVPSRYDEAPHAPSPTRQPYPQVIVVAPPQNQMPGNFPNYSPPYSSPRDLLPAPEMREFRIVGEDDTLD